MLATIYEITILAFFSVWYLLSIVCQLSNPFTKAIRRKDWFSLIPQWTFFAPNPGTKDYHLLYRDMSKTDITSDWEEIEITETRHWWSFVWNPEKRKKKILSDVIQNLIPMIQHYKDDLNTLVFSLPYIAVLQRVTNRPLIFKEAKARQFALAESSGYNKQSEPQLILLSIYHPLN